MWPRRKRFKPLYSDDESGAWFGACGLVVWFLIIVGLIVVGPRIF